MKSFINKNKLLIIYFTSIIIISFISTIFEYMNIPYKMITTIELIINLLFVFLYSYKSTKRNNVKGYKSGLKIIILLLIINLITLKGIGIKNFVYYILIMLLSIGASIICKNKEKNYSSLDLE